jgi:aromatic ring-opening dioxygenase catalytic subunit (LigB family)
MSQTAGVSSTTARQPTLYVSHGGGPCFFMEWGTPHAWESMRQFLAAVPELLPATPTAIVVVSAHFEAHPVSISGGAAPELLYDYSGFPPHTFELTYPAPGHPELAARIQQLLQAAGIPAAIDVDAPFDHGVFIPLKVMWPDASIPVVTVSLHPSLDPAVHLAFGAALEPLRDQGVLIVGSGASYHGRVQPAGPVSESFDAWLGNVMADAPDSRAARLTRWTDAENARLAHPREEHLIPLMVAAGAAGQDASTLIYNDVVLGMRYSGWAFGDVVN